MSATPEDGSRLCLACGLCCKGVLHDWAKVGDGEAEIIERLGLRTATRPEGPVFSLPCHHHRDGRCTVYDERPSTCRGYKCKLLNRCLADEVTWEDGLRRVEQAKRMVLAIQDRCGVPVAGTSVWHRIRALEDEVTSADPELRMDVAALLAFCQHHFWNHAEPKQVLGP